MSKGRELAERNRESWNAVTAAHNSHKREQVEFLRRGGDTLFPEELALLGDLRGAKLLHLLCNCGQDSLCLARRGASVTGVDISDDAIAFARRLAEETGIPAEFERAEVYEWLALAAEAGRRFDVVFASYGVLCWLADLEGWVRAVSEVLAPGGRLVLVEFHPVALLHGDDGARKYDYFADEPVVTSGVPDYVATADTALSPSGHLAGVAEFENPFPDFTYQFGIGQVVSAVLDAGLELRGLEEYPYANGCRVLPSLQQDRQRRWVFTPGEPNLPLMFSLHAEKRTQ